MAQRKSAGSKSPGAKSPSEGRPTEATIPADKKPIPRTPGSAVDAIEAIGGIDAICAALLDGASYSEIAKRAGVARASVHAWIAADADRSARAREARSQAAAAHEERAMSLLEGASDPFALAKAREMAHHLRWRASKVNPRDYGDKVELDAKVTMQSLSDEELMARAAALVQRISGHDGDGANGV